MIINIASNNKIKIEALKDVLVDYSLIPNPKIVPIATKSGVSEQPISLNEIITGAINRAKSAFGNNCKYSFGIESGLFEVPNSKTGFMDITACIIYDGVETFLGLSCAFELPIEATKIVMDEKIDINVAFKKLNLTNKDKLGSSEGAIGLLSKGRVTRKEQLKQSIKMALIQLENIKLYSK